MTELVETSVVNLLIDRVIAEVTHDMIDIVYDETALGLVRVGKLQQDPNLKKLNVLIREGGDVWPDILVPQTYNLRVPQYEFGMSNFWLRRLVAEYTLFFVGSVDRDEAWRRANVVFSRFKKTIVKLPMHDLTDDFGETGIIPQVNRLDTFGSGGPGNWIWKGTHYFEFLTEQSLD